MKDPKKVKAGKARWKGVSKKKRKEHAKMAGSKGGTETWHRIRASRLSKPF